MEDDLSKSMISLKDEGFDNNIQCVQTKSLLNHEELSYKNIEIEFSLNEGKNNNRLQHNEENILSIENDINNQMEDQFPLDENTGLEYYSYLEKTV